MAQSVHSGLQGPKWVLGCLFPDPVSRKSVKSAHSTRNRYSSQWTLAKCQASTPARTLTSDWRTVGAQHGIRVTESDSCSASLSQDTGASAVGGRGTQPPPGTSLLPRHTLLPWSEPPLPRATSLLLRSHWPKLGQSNVCPGGRAGLGPPHPHRLQARHCQAGHKTRPVL